MIAKPYAAMRSNGAWHVTDATGTMVSEHGAGAAGATAATSEAERLNLRQTRTLPAFDLRGWRRTHGYTLKSLSTVLGVGWVTLQRWETGVQAIPPFLHLALESLERKEVASDVL